MRFFYKSKDKKDKCLAGGRYCGDIIRISKIDKRNVQPPSYVTAQPFVSMYSSPAAGRPHKRRGNHP